MFLLLVNNQVLCVSKKCLLFVAITKTTVIFADSDILLTKQVLANTDIAHQ